MEKEDILFLTNFIKAIPGTDLSEILTTYDIPQISYGLNESYPVALLKTLSSNLDKKNYKDCILKIIEYVKSSLNNTLKTIPYADTPIRDDYIKGLEKLSTVELRIKGGIPPSTIFIPPGNPYTAKMKIRELILPTDTAIFVVDPYIGKRTLDCIFSAKGQGINILTSKKPRAIETGLERELNDFVREGFNIEVRRNSDIHDRYIFANNRCWKIGASIKDAGNAELNIDEKFDQDKTSIEYFLLEKWETGDRYFP